MNIWVTIHQFFYKKTKNWNYFLIKFIGADLQRVYHLVYSSPPILCTLSPRTSSGLFLSNLSLRQGTSSPLITAWYIHVWWNQQLLTKGYRTSSPDLRSRLSPIWTWFVFRTWTAVGSWNIHRETSLARYRHTHLYLSIHTYIHTSNIKTYIYTHWHTHYIHTYTHSTTWASCSLHIGRWRRPELRPRSPGRGPWCRIRLDCRN